MQMKQPYESGYWHQHAQDKRNQAADKLDAWANAIWNYSVLLAIPACIVGLVALSISHGQSLLLFFCGIVLALSGFFWYALLHCGVELLRAIGRMEDLQFLRHQQGK